MDLEFVVWEALQDALVSAVDEEGRNWLSSVAHAFAIEPWQLRQFSCAAIPFGRRHTRQEQL